MKQATTKKLFFKKWPIKIECYLKGAYRVHTMGIDKTIKWADNKVSDDNIHWSMFERSFDKPQIADFANKLRPFVGTDHKVRVEGGHYNIFCQDKALANKFTKALEPWITCVTQPASDAEWDFLVAGGHKKVLCNELPHEKFRYKLYFNEKYETTAKGRCLEWIRKYPDTMLVSGNTEKWLTGYYHYIQNPFMYIADDKTLSMVLLYVSGNHRKVEEFILKSSINT